jgi:hypothetical protein
MSQEVVQFEYLITLRFVQRRELVILRPLAVATLFLLEEPQAPPILLDLEDLLLALEPPTTPLAPRLQLVFRSAPWELLVEQGFTPQADR